LLAGGKEDDWYAIECAVRADGVTSPAAEALDALRAGVVDPDPDKEDDEWPDEQQPNDYFKLMAHLRHLVTHGDPPFARCVNDLEDGIWEFKVGSKRFSFFDTDGVGAFEAKLRPETWDDRWSDGDFYWFPNFDFDLRLGHFFVKSGRAAGQDNIDATIMVREEDLSHDRDESTAAAEAELTR
jgi:hypothetical protein